MKSNYQVCAPCLELYYPYTEVNTKGLSSFQAKILITRDRKRQLQEDIDQKLNYYYGVDIYDIRERDNKTISKTFEKL